MIKCPLGPIYWRKVAPGGRVTLPPEPSFTERIYEKIVPANRAKTWFSWVRACSICPDLSLIDEAKITKVFIWKKVGPPPRVTLISKRVTLHPGSPAPRANFAISHVNGSLPFIKKCMKCSLVRGGSVWRVTLLPETTFLHINRPLNHHAQQVVYRRCDRN